MYKKILSMNSQASSTTGGGLNKAENATSTITLKDLKTPLSSSPNAHHHHPQQHHRNDTGEEVDNDDDDVDVNDENAPSNFAIENAVVNGSDKVVYENSYERPLVPTAQTSPLPTHHVSTTPPTPPPSVAAAKMETDDYYAAEHTYPTHKSIHHMATSHYRDVMHDENLENKQQNFVNDEEDVWRPW